MFSRSQNGSVGQIAPRRICLYRELVHQRSTENKKGLLKASLYHVKWCPRRDLNPHVFRQRFLRPPRLPFRHSGAKSNYTRCSQKRKPKFQSTRKKQRYRPKIVRTSTKAETRRLRFEDAKARRLFGSKTSKKTPIRLLGTDATHYSQRIKPPRNSLAYNFDVVGVLARVVGIHRRIFFWR